MGSVQSLVLLVVALEGLGLRQPASPGAPGLSRIPAQGVAGRRGALGKRGLVVFYSACVSSVSKRLEMQPCWNNSQSQQRQGRPAVERKQSKQSPSPKALRGPVQGGHWARVGRGRFWASRLSGERCPALHKDPTASWGEGCYVASELAWGTGGGSSLTSSKCIAEVLGGCSCSCPLPCPRTSVRSKPFVLFGRNSRVLWLAYRFSAVERGIKIARL